MVKSQLWNPLGQPQLTMVKLDQKVKFRAFSRIEALQNAPR